MAMAVVWPSPDESLESTALGRAGRLLVEAVTLNGASRGAEWASHSFNAPAGSYDRWMAMQVRRILLVSAP
jgi:hypothetical protein